MKDYEVEVLHLDSPVPIIRTVRAADDLQAEDIVRSWFPDATSVEVVNPDEEGEE